MNRRSGRWLSLLFILAAPSAKAAEHPGMERLWADYLKLKTVHYVAKEARQVPESPGLDCTGSYEYWSDGEKFKIVEKWDPFIRPRVSYEEYWDGTNFAEEQIGASSIIVASKPDLFLKVNFPSLLVPFQVLKRGGKEEGKQFTLAQLQSEDYHKLLNNFTMANADPLKAEFPGPLFDYSRVPEAKFLQFDSNYSISFDKDNRFPVSIRRIARDNNYPPDIRKAINSYDAWEKWEIQYKAYSISTGEITLPLEVKHTTVGAFGTRPPRTGVFVFTIMSIDINQKIDPTIFSKDLRMAKEIIDLDQREKRKH